MIGLNIGIRTSRAGLAIGVPASEDGPSAPVGQTSFTVTKTGGTNAAFDAGASSVQSCAGDCRVEMTVNVTGKERAFGLSASDPDTNYNTIDYGYDLPSTTLYVIERVGPVLTAFGTFAPGDVLAVERVGTTINYLKNGGVVYTSAKVSTGPLRIDTALADSASSLNSLKLFDAGSPVALTWQNIVNVTVV